MKKYKHLFFDLDHTLWDFERNSSEVLSEIYINFLLKSKTDSSLASFKQKYYRINDSLWSLYRQNKISQADLRTNRFYNTLLECGIDDKELSTEIGNFYVNTSPYKTYLFADCIEVLTALQQKYELHIITNGFKEVQLIKIKQSKLAPFFKHIITSEEAKAKKPDIVIFDYSLACVEAKPTDCLMIGDSLEADIEGAMNASIDQVYFNPLKEISSCTPTFEISTLKELLHIL